jgi:hypothetical protein
MQFSLLPANAPTRKELLNGAKVAGEMRHMLNAMGLGSRIDKHQGYALNFLSTPVKLEYINANLLGLI